MTVERASDAEKTSRPGSPLLTAEDVAARSRGASGARGGRTGAPLPETFRLRVKDGAIFTLGLEELQIRRRDPLVGDAICLVSGGRTTFRRVLAIDGTHLRLRGDIAPFEDAWDTVVDGPVAGCVEGRVFDQFMALDPIRLTRANWYAALTAARALSARKRLARLRSRSQVRFRTQALEPSDWPSVRAFWLEACGDPLPVEANEDQHVIGLYDESDRLVGATIHLKFGTVSYSAFTLVDRRFRQQGGGRAMIEHAIRHARGRGLTLVYVHIHVRNIPSILAYERVGFTPVRWWRDEADPLLAAERQWKVFELAL